MGISESHRQFAFKIEPKPGGGYVSTSENPALVFEGATQEEVQQKALEKAGELAGPGIAAVIKDLQKPGAGAVAGEKKFSISINKKISFSIGKKQSPSTDSPAQLASAESDPFPQSSQGGLSSTVKLLIVAAVLMLIFLLVYRR